MPHVFSAPEDRKRVRGSFLSTHGHISCIKRVRAWAVQPLPVNGFSFSLDEALGKLLNFFKLVLIEPKFSSLSHRIHLRRITRAYYCASHSRVGQRPGNRGFGRRAIIPSCDIAQFLGQGQITRELRLVKLRAVFTMIIFWPPSTISGRRRSFMGSCPSKRRFVGIWSLLLQMASLS